jgi:basic membrane protein A
MNLARLLLAILTVASLLVPASAEDAKVPRVFAAYVTPVEEPWNGVIHKALLDAKEAKQIQYTFADRLAKATDLDKALREQAKTADIIFVDGYDHPKVVTKAAADFPKVAFIVGTDGAPREPNVSVFNSLLEEPSYLCGLIAGKMTKSNVVGIVAGKDEPATNGNLNAFIQGAREANERIKVKVAYIDSWYDPDKAAEEARKQMEAGADLIFAERVGVAAAAKGKKVLLFGNLVDRNAAAPDLTITGPIWDMGPAVKHVLTCVKESKYKPEDLRKLSNVASGGARLAPWHGWDKKLPADVMKLVQEKETLLKKGELKLKTNTERPKGD